VLGVVCGLFRGGVVAARHGLGREVVEGEEGGAGSAEMGEEGLE
jgi:hypothetical protein